MLTSINTTKRLMYGTTTVYVRCSSEPVRTREKRYNICVKNEFKRKIYGIQMHATTTGLIYDFQS